MAINYLNTVDLNKNQLNNAAIQNLTTDPATGVLGQVYYNTTDSVLKICVTASTVTPTPAVWTEVGGGVETLTTTDGTYIDLTPNTPVAGAVTVTADLSAVDGTPTGGRRFLTKDNTWAVPVISDQDTTYTLPVSAGTAVTGYTVADIDLTAGGSGSGIASKVTFAGKNDNILISETTLNNGIVNIALTDDVVIDNDLTVGGEISQTSTGNENTFASELNMSSLNITNLLDPTSPQHAATKQYVDAVTAGGLIYQGGYDASTNTPSIDRSTGATATNIYAMGNGGGPISATEVQTVATTGTGVGLTLTITLNSAGNLTSAVIANRGKGYASGDTVGLLGLSGHTGSIVQITAVASVGSVAPAIGIETGWTYTVIDDGTFYGEIVRVGDVLIAESDDPGNLENWTTVQNNIDLASLTQVGIGNVIAATADDLLGMNVAYSGGTATVGLNITGLNAITTTDDTSELAIYDEDNTTNKKISVGNLALAGNSGTSKKGEIAIGDLTETVTVPATWGFDTMVQTRNAAGDTVFCDVTRTATSVTATMSTAQTALTGGIITILVQKIG